MQRVAQTHTLTLNPPPPTRSSVQKVTILSCVLFWSAETNAFAPSGFQDKQIGLSFGEDKRSSVHTKVYKMAPPLWSRRDGAHRSPQKPTSNARKCHFPYQPQRHANSYQGTFVMVSHLGLWLLPQLRIIHWMNNCFKCLLKFFTHISNPSTVASILPLKSKTSLSLCFGLCYSATVCWAELLGTAACSLCLWEQGEVQQTAWLQKALLNANQNWSGWGY